jgi:lipopolysaccharide transport system permease protein
MKPDYKKRLFNILLHADSLWALSRKELTMKYRGTKLGLWWALILPLLLALSINLIFTKAFKVTIPNYTMFILSAILPWIFFSQSLSEATNSFPANASILKQGVFPREIIPFSSVFGNFLNFIAGLAVIMPLFILLNHRVVFLMPILVLLLLSFAVFVCGLGLIFSSINMFYKDVSCFLSLGLTVWFWITPVFYSRDMVPYPYSIINLINPLTLFISNFRDILFYGKVDIYAFFAGILVSLAFFLGGYYFFLIKERELLKRL